MKWFNCWIGTSERNTEKNPCRTIELSLLLRSASTASKPISKAFSLVRTFCMNYVRWIWLFFSSFNRDNNQRFFPHHFRKFRTHRWFLSKLPLKNNISTKLRITIAFDFYTRHREIGKIEKTFGIFVCDFHNWHSKWILQSDYIESMLHESTELFIEKEIAACYFIFFNSPLTLYMTQTIRENVHRVYGKKPTSKTFLHKRLNQ